MVWAAGTPSSSASPLATFDKGSGAPCTSLALRGSHLVAGYATGHVRVFRMPAATAGSGAGAGAAATGSTAPSASGGFLEVEIAAHARAVMSVCFHPSRSTFASVGEDSVVNVWSLPETSTSAGTGLGAGAGAGAGMGAGASSSKVLLDMSAPIADRILTGAAFVPSQGGGGGGGGGGGAVAHLVVAPYDRPNLRVFLALG
jgi:hypothetical protein